MIKDRFGTLSRKSARGGRAESWGDRIPPSEAETRTAETLLADPLGLRAAIERAETIWGRNHVVRLH